MNTSFAPPRNETGAPVRVNLTLKPMNEWHPEMMKFGVRHGVIDLPETSRPHLVDLLTFRRCPTPVSVDQRADAVVEMFIDAISAGSIPPGSHALIDGPTFMIASLQRAMASRSITTWFLYDGSEWMSDEDKMIAGEGFGFRGFV